MRWKMAAALLVAVATPVAVALMLHARAGDIYPGEARWVLAAPEKFELLTLEPDVTRLPPNILRLNKVGGYDVTAAAPIADRDTQQALLAALEADIAGGDDHLVSGCFQPHHALRLERAGHRVELLICYQCHGLLILADSQPRRHTLTGSSQGMLDQTLRAHGLRPVSDLSPPATSQQALQAAAHERVGSP